LTLVAKITYAEYRDYFMNKKNEVVTSLPEPPISQFLFADTRLSWIWLVLRIYVAWQWLQAGYEKL
jgi:thiosulfate dehydrogenase (quinone) large subunit